MAEAIEEISGNLNHEEPINNLDLTENDEFEDAIEGDESDSISEDLEDENYKLLLKKEESETEESKEVKTRSIF